uniref:Uncharacterized protein n=1 Tax=viral metagenome TaxID=1070528 RepID=A0A6C0BA61_9ZZZZ
MNLIEYIYYSLIATGIIIIIITFGLSSIIGYIVGYSFIGAGFFLLAGYLMFKLSSSNKGGILSILTSIGPILVIVAAICYYLSIIGIYKDRITNGNIDPDYYSFSSGFLLCILFQTFFFYKAITTEEFKKTYTIDKVTSMILYFLGILSVVLVITINIILAYFSTDG